MLAADYRFSVGIIAGTVHSAVFHEHIVTADSEELAGCVQLTAADDEIFEVDACNAVVAGDKAAVLDEGMNTVVEMDAVVTSEADNISHIGVHAVIELMHEIAVVLNGVAAERDIFAVGQENSVGAAEAFFPLRIKAVLTVNQRTFFADDCDILRAVSGNDSPAVFVLVGCHIGVCSVIFVDQFHVRTQFNTFGNRAYRVIRAFFAAEKNRAGFQKNGGVGVHEKSCRCESALGNNDRSAGFTAEIKYALNCFGLKLV